MNQTHSAYLRSIWSQRALLVSTKCEGLGKFLGERGFEGDRVVTALR